MGLSSQLLLSVPLLPGCRALPGSRTGGAGRTQTPCELARSPLQGTYMLHRISWVDEPQELHSQGREDLVQRSREHGAAARHRGHELSAATCIKVDLIRGISTLLRADPYQLGSVLVRCGSKRKSLIGLLTGRAGIGLRRIGLGLE